MTTGALLWPQVEKYGGFPFYLCKPSMWIDSFFNPLPAQRLLSFSFTFLSEYYIFLFVYLECERNARRWFGQYSAVGAECEGSVKLHIINI